MFEKGLKLVENEIRIASAKNLCHKSRSRAHDKRGNVEGGENKLRLDELVEVVQSRHVWRPIAHDQVRLFPIEMTDDFVRRRRGSNVAL